MSARPAPITIGVFIPSDPRAPLAVLIREALALQASGADIIEIDALVIGEHAGAFAAVDDDTIALLVASLVADGVEVGVSTDRPELAGIAAEHGAAWVLDPSAGGDTETLLARLRGSGCGLLIGPWGRPRHEVTPIDPTDAYTEGVVRNAARLLAGGFRGDRLGVDAGVGLRPDDAEPWRILNALDRLVALGYPVVVPATERFLSAMVADESEAHRLDEAAIAIAVLASGVGAWAVQTQRVDVVASTLRRMHGLAFAGDA